MFLFCLLENLKTLTVELVPIVSLEETELFKLIAIQQDLVFGQAKECLILQSVLLFFYYVVV